MGIELDYISLCNSEKCMVYIALTITELVAIWSDQILLYLITVRNEYILIYAWYSTTNELELARSH